MNKKEFSTPLDLKQIRVTDAFWQREQELVRTQVIPYQWEALNDRVTGAAPSYCMHNFRAAGRLVREKKEKGQAYVEPAYTFRGFEALPEDPAHPDPDKFYGFVFQDTDFSKWIEAVAYSLTWHPDAELEKTADEAIEIVCAAQLENGYLDTYYIINGMDRAFTNLRDHHELYCLGHLTEGAVAYYQATGKERLLQAACRYADYVADYFGPEEGKCKGYPGHEIAEMALVRLYEVTGEEKYLRLSRFFLEQRGQQPYYFEEEERRRMAYEGKAFKPNTDPMRYAYHQAHKPVREQEEAVGHAVRAVYLYSGMADVARLTGDEAMLQACERLWDSIARKKLYVTGGIGGTHVGEAFSYPYDLPNATAYSETCAAIGLAFFARRMLEIKADRKYADVMELALYNTVLSGMALDGKSFFYVNPLEVVPEACHKDARKSHVKPVRQKWFGCACCPPNIARIVSSVAAYAYTESEDTLWTHLYMGSKMTKQIKESSLDLNMETSMPWEGGARLSIHAKMPTACTLAFRIPGWCDDWKVEVCCGGRTEAYGAAAYEAGAYKTGTYEPGRHGVEAYEAKAEGVTVRDGYLYLKRIWQDGDVITLIFSMPVHMKMANTGVREDIGRVAFTRGPITYCMEGIDNGENLHLCRVDTARLGHQLEGIQLKTTQELGHSMVLLRVPGLRMRSMQENGAEQPLYMDYTPAEEDTVTLTLLPYYAWCNRGETEMSVWIRL